MDSNAARLSGVRTYVLVALIFEILAIIGFAFGAWGTIGGLIAITSSGAGPVGVGAYYAYGGIGMGVVFFLLGIALTVLVAIRTNRMLGAINAGNVAALKRLSSVGWAIIALVFSGIIPGIMLLIADGPIKGLDERATATTTTTTTTASAQSPQSTPVSGMQNSQSSTFCRNCGNQLAPDSKFCNKCGTKV